MRYPQLVKWCLFFSIMGDIGIAVGDERPGTASPGVWGLRPNDSFIVDVLIGRETVVQQSSPDANTAQFGNPLARESGQDRFTLEYRVNTMDSAGTLQVNVLIRSAVRTWMPSDISESRVEQRTLDMLEGVQLAIQVNADGEVEGVDESDRDALISRMSGLNSGAEGFLRECCSSENLAAWFAKPFWLSGIKVDADGVSSVRDVRDEVSLGTMGRLRVNVRIQPEKESTVNQRNGFYSCDVIGKARFVPVDGLRNGTISFQPRRAELATYSGVAVMARPGDRQGDAALLRPAFDQLDLTYVIDGICDVVSRDETKSVAFRQTQVQTWTLRASQMRRNFTDQSNRLLLPQRMLP